MFDWISTKEQLPETRENVIVATSDKRVYPAYFIKDPTLSVEGAKNVVGRFELATFLDFHNPPDNRYAFIELIEGEEWLVTHWQHLPEAP